MRLVQMLILTFLCAFVFVFAFLTIQEYYTMLDKKLSEIEYVKADIQNQLTKDAAMLKRFENNYKATLDDLYNKWKKDANALEQSDLTVCLEEIVKKNAHVSEINIIDKDGMIINSTDGGNIGYDMKSEEQSSEFYNQAIASKGNCIFQDLQERGRDGKQMRYVGLAMQTDDAVNDIVFQIGIDQATVDLINTTSNILSVAPYIKTNQYDFTLIVDKSGRILSSVHASMIYDNIQNFIEIALKEPSGTQDAYFNEKKILYVYDSFQIPNNELAQSYLMTNDDTGYIIGIVYYSEMFRVRDLVVLVLAVMLPLVLLVIFLAVSKIVKTQVLDGIYMLNGGMKKIISGDISVKLNVDQNIEFAQLSQDINSTVAALKGHIELEKHRNEQELELAWTIQSATLPDYRSFIRVPEVDIYTYITPAKNVGGDFYDFFRLGANKFAFLIADVSGKGIPAALFMMNVKNSIKNYMLQGMPVSTALTLANNELCKNNDEMMFATVFAAIFDVKTGQLECVNAGHTPPVLIRGDQITEINCKKRRILAALPDIELKSEFFQLKRGDKLLLYTDGITEALNEMGKLFAKRRMLEALQRVKYETGLRLIGDGLLAELDDFVGNAEQADDIALLLFSWEDKVKRIHVPAKMEELPGVFDELKAFLDQTRASEKIKKQFTIALEEIFVNIVSYAYVDQEDGMIEISLYTREDGNKIVLRIVDNGIAFDPTDIGERIQESDVMDVAIGGLGLFMVSNFMDDVQYERTDDQNILYLVKKIGENKNKTVEE
ncbi:MAG: SpoIIE family protein phosphatase [Christensenella sp.]